ncbi:MAG: triose-phosphate isomerase [Alphaproteobacteria bacterium]|nr:triose-phosphate isomerase [Alphaproteobacteria bacterium]
MARRRLIAGNWKMNGGLSDSRALVRAICDGLDGALSCDVLVCPPFPLLGAMSEALDGQKVRLGAQDCHPADAGAHTGDVSAVLLAELGCSAVIVGHSERRADHGESNALVRDKAAAAHRARLTAIVCVGETLDERDAGRTAEVVVGQVDGSLPDGWSAENTVIAYEPVWAIGTGRTPEVGDIAAVHAEIRNALSARSSAAVAEATRILYGGSVKAANAEDIMALVEVDGGLVGGASLDAKEFLAIIAAA